MEHISIFNYEAFYLDFLEGNLSEQDATLLLAFLEEHPELKISDEAFPVLEDDSFQLDNQFKANLKQPIFNETTISLLNVEQFLIAETEGLLSTAKKKELTTFISGNSDLRSLQKIYASTHLVADRSILFEDKNSLKHTKRISLWPILSLAAAASVAILFFLWNPTTDVLNNNSHTSFSQNKIKKGKPGIVKKKNDSKILKENQDEENIPNVLVPEQNKPEMAAVVAPSVLFQVIKGLPLNKIKELKGSNQDLEIIENYYASNTIVEPEVVKPESDYVLGFDEMNNPIKPITNRLANAVKREVDFRTAKATSKRTGGFYIKIGKLEISHRTSK